MSTVAGTVTVAASPRVRVARRRFYVVLPLLMAVAVFIGFAPSYYLKGVYGTRPLSALYHVHGVLFTCWLLLMIAQPALVWLRRTDLHRRVGSVAAFLIAAMMVAGYFVSIDMGRRGVAPPGLSALTFMIVPLATLVVFPALTGAALVWKASPQIHKRLMLIATLELVPAGFGRWPALVPYGPLAFFGLTDLFIVAMLAYDRMTTGRFHPATVYGGGFLLVSQVGRIVVGNTTGWQSFAGWLLT